MKTGRPCIYENDDKGLKKFEDRTRMFLEDLQETGVPFSVKRWADYLDVTRPTLYSIMKRGEVWTSMIPKDER